MNRFAPWVLIPCVAAAACSTRNAPESVGSARLTITSVPSSVGCVQLIAAASRTVTQSVNVTTGQTVTLTMNDIPAGDVTFTAFGFAQGCNAIVGAQPNWGSSPTVATITPGQVVSLQLALDQVGGANVGISFNTDGGAASPDLSTPPDLATSTAVLAADPTSLMFGILQQKTCTITNVGSVTSLPLMVQMVPSGAFNVTGCSGLQLQAGGSCVVTLLAGVSLPSSATLTVSAGPGVAVSVAIQPN
jgi:hypothetical protein